MPLRDHLTTDQIDQAVLSLLPGDALVCKDGRVVRYTSRLPVVEVKTKKKTKRGRRRRSSKEGNSL